MTFCTTGLNDLIYMLGLLYDREGDFNGPSEKQIWGAQMPSWAVPNPIRPKWQTSDVIIAPDSCMNKEMPISGSSEMRHGHDMMLIQAQHEGS